MGPLRTWGGSSRGAASRKVFISYRRDDSLIHSRLLHNELAARFGAGQVFMDLDDIRYGDEFKRVIDGQLDAADVVVAVIGPHWLEMLQDRLERDDYVRHELTRALALSLSRGLRVIPVLVGGASLPAEGLPAELAALRTLNCLTIDPRADLLKPQVNALVEAILERSWEEEARRLRQRIWFARFARYLGVGVGLSMFFAVWVALLDFVGLDTRVATATMWLGAVGAPVPWSDEVVLVAIDERTEQHVGRRFDASWRSEHARLIEQLARAGARTVAFDLFLEQAGDTDADAPLEAAIDAAGNTAVVFGVHEMEADGVTPRLLPRFATRARWGIACAGHKLGYARSLPLAVHRPGDDQVFASIALAAFAGVGSGIESYDGGRRELRVRVGQTERTHAVGFSHIERVRAEQPGCGAIRGGDQVAMQLFDPTAIPAFSRSGEPPRPVAYEAILELREAAELALFEGKIVVVGLRQARRDVVSVAGGSGGTPRWGVDLIAAQIDAMVRGAVIRPLPAWGEFLHMAGLGLGGAFASRSAQQRSRYTRWTVLAACMLLYVAAAVLVYRTQQVLIAVPYGLGALWLAWWAMARMHGRGAS